MATSIAIDECGICQEQFQDPRSLPCLHTFCLECLQRSLDENGLLKCPVCRAKHELTKDRVGLLPVDQCVLQQLPLRLQQQEEIVGDDRGDDNNCGFCGEDEAPVAWCSDCGVLICNSCLSLHKKMAYLKGHRIIFLLGKEDQSGTLVASGCLWHSGQDIKYLCTRCSETVCSDCLLLGPHKDHQYSTVEEARRGLEKKMRGLMDSVVMKKEEFSKYLEKVDKVEGEALERSDFMAKEVNNMFDGIVASVEAQRNEALQSVSQGVKEIWSQKEMLEVSMAQLDSFTQFADRIQKCATDSSYVSMAAQGIKLMNRLKSTHGDKHVLDLKKTALGSRSSEVIPFGDMFRLGQPVLQFSPKPGSNISFLSTDGSGIHIMVSLMVGGLPVASRTLKEKCELLADARCTGILGYPLSVPCEVKLVKSSTISWNVNIGVKCSDSNKELTLRCKVSGGVATISKKVTFKCVRKE